METLEEEKSCNDSAIGINYELPSTLFITCSAVLRDVQSTEV